MDDRHQRVGLYGKQSESMSSLPPEGSHWVMETVDGRQQILMPYPPAGIGRFFVALSLLTLDTGFPPFRLPSGQQMPRDQFKLLFPKRRRVEFSPSDLRTMTLRKTETGNRLTIDKGAERIEVATGASEIEREWLFDVLQNAYGTQQA